MEATIDRFGRLVIPIIVREHLGLKPGSTVQLKEQDHEVLLIPKHEKSHLQRQGHVLVFIGKATGDIDHATEAARKDRLKHLLEDF